MSRIIERALSIINDNLKDQTSSFADPISIKPMARGGRLLEDDYPTHYMPHVGRQVMRDGGAPVQGFEGRVMAPAPVEEEPAQATQSSIDYSPEDILAAKERRAQRIAGKAWDMMSQDQKSQFMSVPEKYPLSDDEIMRMDRAYQQKFHGPWYHGSQRIDRVVGKNRIDPKRATSGPMPYFTDNPEIASNYATGKQDTSLARSDTGDVENYFTVNPKDLGLRSRSPITVERSWHFLDPEIKQKIKDNALRVGYENPDEHEGELTLHPEGVNGSIAGEDHYNYILKHEAQNNPLKALRILWHDSGDIFNQEEKLADIFKLAGYPHEISQDAAPWTEAKGIFPAMLRIENPLITHDEALINERVIPHLEQAFAKDRTRKKEHGADLWDKNTRYTPKEWVAQLKEDMSKKDNSYAWTSIPDKVTEELKKLGFDGIIDTGGKGGGESHRVAIPFHPHQVRSKFAKFDPNEIGSEDIMKAEGGEVDSGLTSYHGSPHEFDEFDAEKIGTGEGAQAYGHGLYFAENENVARNYLGDPEARYKRFSGHMEPKEEFAFDVATGTSSPRDMDVMSKLVSKYGENISFDEAQSLAKKALKDRGHMYEVRLNIHPDKIIDWNKPISEQPHVLDALNKYVDEMGGHEELSNHAKSLESKRAAEQEHFAKLWDDSDQPLDLDYFNKDKYVSKDALADLLSEIKGGKSPTGEDFYRALSPQEYDYKGATETARKLGLHGIKYLDAGSRGKDGQVGSRNYVVFNPEHIAVKRRYAEGGGIKAFAIGNSVPHLDRASSMIDTHDDIQLAPGVEAIEQMPDQAFTSADTSRNQIPALFNSASFERKRGNRNLDYGGGAFDKGTEYLAQEHGVDSQVYDPFNRSKEHNDIVLKGFKDKPADTATVSNVLNVIAEPEARLHVIKQVYNHVKPDGKAYFTVYEGEGKDKAGGARMTRDGWQEFRPTHSYIDEISQVFPSVKLSGKTIVASKKAEKAYGGAIPGPRLTEDNADDFARRLIAWTFATAPLFQRASGGEVSYPVAIPTEIKEDIKAGKAKMKHLSPQEFLNETDPLHIGKGDRHIIHSFEKHIKSGDHLGPLKIYEEGHQDGRHRANAAKDLGVKKVPVVDYRKAAGGAVDDDNWEDAFHATHANVQQFDLSKSGSATTAGGSKAERAIFLTNDPENAKTYLGGQFVKRENAPHTEEMDYGVGRHYAEGANIMPLKVNTNDFDEWDYGGNLYDANHMKQIIKEARKNKAPGIKITNIKDQGYMGLGSGKKTTTYVVLDPSRIRSKFAKFDPSKTKKKDLMAAQGGAVIDAALDVLSKLRR